MNRIIKLLLGIVVLAAAWFFVSPLFIDRSVDESFDLVLDDGQLNIKGIMAMPADEQRAMMPDIMTAAAKAPDRSMTEGMPVEGPAIVARGQFVDADVVHKGSGQATLYALPDGKRVVRLEDFRVTNGPALVVYLAKHPAPTEARHVADDGYVNLGELKGNVGNQNYVVPAGTNIDDYNSVVIWCELFGVLFSPAALTRT